MNNNNNTFPYLLPSYLKTEDILFSILLLGHGQNQSLTLVSFWPFIFLHLSNFILCWKHSWGSEIS